MAWAWCMGMVRVLAAPPSKLLAPPALDAVTGGPLEAEHACHRVHKKCHKVPQSAQKCHKGHRMHRRLPAHLPRAAAAAGEQLRQQRDGARLGNAAPGGRVARQVAESGCDHPPQDGVARALQRAQQRGDDLRAGRGTF